MIQIFGNFLETLFNKDNLGKALVFGDYVERPQQDEHLTLGFSPSAIPIKKRWRNNGLSADYIANYLATFFPIQALEPDGMDKLAEMKSAVSYIANELLENSMKYSDATALYPITLHTQIENNKIRLFVDNSILPSQAKNFQVFIRELLNSNPDELFIRKLEENAEDENTGSSGLGFLTMINDYSAKLGWKFDIVEKDSPVITVTTMVELAV
ncbi:MAG: ATP-binding protein [Cyanobacteria bacterium J06633_8]